MSRKSRAFSTGTHNDKRIKTKVGHYHVTFTGHTGHVVCGLRTSTLADRDLQILHIIRGPNDRGCGS